MKILKLLIISVGLVLFSCNSEEFQIEEPRSEPEVRTDTPLSFSFTYQGKEYHSEYILETDSTWILANKDVEKLMMKFAQDTAISLLVKEDRSMEYFDNSNILKEYLEKEKKSTKSDYPRPGQEPEAPSSAFLSVWNDANGKGYWAGHDIKFQPVTSSGSNRYSQSSAGIPSVGSKMNDKISSFELFGLYVTFYEHDWYGGQSITFFGGNEQRHVFCPDLKWVARPYYYNGTFYTGHWNDMISSFKLHNHPTIF